MFGLFDLQQNESELDFKKHRRIKALVHINNIDQLVTMLLLPATVDVTKAPTHLMIIADTQQINAGVKQ